jgi:hypothetical protein
LAEVAMVTFWMLFRLHCFHVRGRHKEVYDDLLLWKSSYSHVSCSLLKIHQSFQLHARVPECWLWNSLSTND